MKNRIKEIQIIPIKPKDGLVAFASLVFDDQLYLGSIGIYTKLNDEGYRLTYPTKMVGVRNLNVYHPINRGLSKEIENEVIKRYKEVMEKSNDRHNSFNFI